VIARSRAGSGGGTLSSLRVLVVEDDRDSREANMAALACAGAQVSSAANVRDALAQISRTRFDVVVSDIGMPHEDGFELIQALRARPQDGEERTTAVALTAFAGAEDERRALAAGYDAFLAKPADVDALLDVLGSLTRASED
jgi:CheY-like chemotaxis protein